MDSSNMASKAANVVKKGVDIVKDTGDVIGDAAKEAVKKVGQGTSNVVNSMDRD